MKRTCVALAAALLISIANGCGSCRNSCRTETVCAPATPCCTTSSCAPTCNSCASGAPMGGYSDPGIQYAPSMSGAPMHYGNSAPLPAGP